MIVGSEEEKAMLKRMRRENWRALIEAGFDPPHRGDCNEDRTDGFWYGGRICFRFASDAECEGSLMQTDLIFPTDQMEADEVVRLMKHIAAFFGVPVGFRLTHATPDAGAGETYCGLTAYDARGCLLDLDDDPTCKVCAGEVAKE
jgi:hypothetical protein